MFAIRRRAGGNNSTSGSNNTTLSKSLVLLACFGGIRLAYWIVNHSGLIESE